MDLWSENAPPLALFSRYSTQWRVGPAGAVGLDYTVFFHDLDRKGVSGRDFDEMMDALRVIESAALEELHKE